MLTAYWHDRLGGCGGFRGARGVSVTADGAKPGDGRAGHMPIELYEQYVTPVGGGGVVDAAPGPIACGYYDTSSNVLPHCHWV